MLSSYQNQSQNQPFQKCYKMQKLKMHSFQFYYLLLVGILLTLLFIIYLNSTNFDEITSKEAQLHLSSLQHQRLRKNESQSHSFNMDLPSKANILKSWNSTLNPVHLYPKPWKLIDLEIHYLLNSHICGPSQNTNLNENEGISVIIIITSHARNFEIREKIRGAVPTKDLAKLGIRRGFLLGQMTEPQTSEFSKLKSTGGQDDFQQLLQKEHELNSDLIVGSFYESYKNLTYKHLMGLEWVTRYCSNALYVVKQDDDIFLDYYQLTQILSQINSTTTQSTNGHSKIKNHPGVQQILSQISSAPSNKFILGKTLEHQKVIRDPNSKWFVSPQEFQKEVYPPFVSGWAYLTTVPVVRDLLYTANKKDSDRGESRQYFWIDDVHITGTLRERSKIKMIDLSKLFTHYKGHLLCCLTPSHVQSKSNHEPFWCDFIAGPTMDGNGELFNSLHQHARFCYTSQVCVRREEDEELNTTCVVTQDSFNFQSQNYYFDKGRQNKNANSNAHLIQAQNVQGKRGRGEWRVMNL